MQQGLNDVLRYSRAEASKLAKALSEALDGRSALRLSAYPTASNVSATLLLLAAFYEKAPSVVLDYELEPQPPSQGKEVALRLEKAKEGSHFRLVSGRGRGAGELSARFSLASPLAALLIAEEVSMVKPGTRALALAAALQELPSYSEISNDFLALVSSFYEGAKVAKKFFSFYYSEGRGLATSVRLTVKPYLKGLSCASEDQLRKLLAEAGLNPDKALDEQEPEALKKLLEGLQKEPEAGRSSELVAPLAAVQLEGRLLDLRELATALEAVFDVSFGAALQAFALGDPHYVLEAYYNVAFEKVCEHVEQGKQLGVAKLGSLTAKVLRAKDPLLPYSAALLLAEALR